MTPERLAELKAIWEMPFSPENKIELHGPVTELFLAMGELLAEVERLTHDLRNAEQAAQGLRTLAERRGAELDRMRERVLALEACAHETTDALRAQLAKTLWALRLYATCDDLCPAAVSGGEQACSCGCEAALRELGGVEA